jgi:hypothetical protein
MLIKFKPNYTITPKIMNCLLSIESVKAKVLHLPLSPKVLTSLRETAKLYTTHYSTMIEGNRLDPDQIEVILKHEGHFPGRVREEHEVKGYYAALTQLEQWVAQSVKVTEKVIKSFHGLVMSDGQTNVKPTEYRNGQNVIRDARTKGIVYLPPEAKDVPDLMAEMVSWINQMKELPCPIIASIAHYQFATIHPYYDGNGRTARLLTTLILHLGGYDLKGLYSLEEYYARNLGAYYEAISIGDSHNYYMGRAGADITKWIEYFVEGMMISFQKVLQHMIKAEKTGEGDHSEILRKLDPRQRKALELFQQFEFITSSQIGDLFGFKPRTSAAICASWVHCGFLKVVDSSNRGRKYGLNDDYVKLVS